MYTFLYIYIVVCMHTDMYIYIYIYYIHIHINITSDQPEPVSPTNCKQPLILFITILSWTLVLHFCGWTVGGFKLDLFACEHHCSGWDQPTVGPQRIRGVDQKVRSTWDDHWGNPLKDDYMGKVTHGHLGARNIDQPPYPFLSEILVSDIHIHLLRFLVGFVEDRRHWLQVGCSQLPVLSTLPNGD